MNAESEGKIWALLAYPLVDVMIVPTWNSENHLVIPLLVAKQPLLNRFLHECVQYHIFSYKKIAKKTFVEKHLRHFLNVFKESFFAINYSFKV
mgnify:CR=1 FL=1